MEEVGVDIPARDKSGENIDFVTRFKHYQRYPLSWIKDYFGDNLRTEAELLIGQPIGTESGLTTQQEEAFRQLGLLISAKLNRHFRKPLTPEEEEIVDKIGLSIQAAQGVGKDFWGALVMLFFLTCFPDVKGMATANTEKQLRNVYWAELSKLMRLSLKIDPSDPQSPTVLQELLVWQSDKIYWKASGGKEWFAEAIVSQKNASPEDQGTTLAGRHEKFMCIIVDEAAGVEDGVMDPLEGTLTGVVNLVFLIFNPTKNTGYAINSQKDDSRYIPLRWSGEESEIVTDAKIAADAKKHGRSSNYFRIRCLGLPPLVDEDTLIPYQWVEAAVVRHEEDLITITENDPVLCGMDPAAGGDNAIHLSRTGRRVDFIRRSNTKDTMVLTSQFAGWLTDDEYDAGFIDNIGIGAGVYDRLREMRYKNIFAVDVRKTPESEMDAEKFPSTRDMLWWRMRKAFEEGNIAIPRNNSLMSQLSDIKYETSGKGVIKIETKKQLKKRGLASPDEADALMMTFFKEDRIFRRGKEAHSNKIDFSGVFLR